MPETDAEKQKKYYRRHREEILAKARARYAMRENEMEMEKLASRFGIQLRRCRECGAVVKESSPYRSYCSGECYRAHWIRRGREGVEDHGKQN